MSDQPRLPTVTGTDRQYETFLAAAEAERDRYQLLLDINQVKRHALGAVGVSFGIGLGLGAVLGILLGRNGHRGK